MRRSRIGSRWSKTIGHLLLTRVYHSRSSSFAELVEHFHVFSMLGGSRIFWPKVCCLLWVGPALAFDMLFPLTDTRKHYPDILKILQ